MDMIDKCETVAQVEYFERDLEIGKKEMKDKIDKVKDPEQKKYMQEHLKWLNTTYSKALQNKKKELRKKNNNSLKEAYIDSMERQIVDLKRKRSKGVLEGMIYNVTESSVIDDEMKSIYFENGKLNLDKIVEETALLYGFLEMVNLCYMKKVDEQYILDNINGLKK